MSASPSSPSPVVEAIIGRRLRLAEHAIDVLRLDRALNTAKDEVERAVRAEVGRAARVSLRRDAQLRLQVTRGMLRPLERLYRIGREEALLELARAGYTPRHAASGRKYEDAAFHYHPLDPLRYRIRDLLDLLGIRATREAVTLDLSGLTADAIARALMRLPGGRDLASRVVSTALFSGMGQTFEENEGLVSGWQRTAVLDGGTCGPCDESDGTEYATWADAQTDMPDGGPAVNCEGGPRCRCRLVPLPA